MLDSHLVKDSVSSPEGIKTTYLFCKESRVNDPLPDRYFFLPCILKTGREYGLHDARKRVIDCYRSLINREVNPKPLLEELLILGRITAKVIEYPDKFKIKFVIPHWRPQDYLRLQKIL